MTTFAEFCAGIGGFRLGLEQLGWECIYSNEMDGKCEETYRENFGVNFDSHNIFDIDPRVLPDFDVLCAGFPCQSFSIAGNRKGFNDERGTVYFKIEEIIEEKEPKVVFLENVKHLVSHDKKRTFQYIVTSLENLGYTVFYNVLDSSYFGVPQSRQRIYIIAFRNDLGVNLFNTTEKRTYRTAFRSFINSGDYSIPVTDRWQEYIDLYTGNKVEEEISFEVPKTRKKLERVGKDVDLNNCIFQIRSSGIRAVSIDHPFPTFAVSNSGGGAMIPVYSGERRHLNLVEMKRIMGFPDNYQFTVARTDAIKQLANAVCPPVITSIGRDINEYFIE
ncbi:DNA (cytosine-5-)-methyltransferase [Bacillus wiedmannii]|uniref:DNA (cytosine-5-)-methyltransferase n=1 Tax=Bacillus wiedmannii TaxID=1890302 RepID=UPI000BF5A007|nr:DNA (cytosine-5-)-methyltransferase [Bacillus wiedmannii]PGD03051.1 DNA (cytosine-5-)-methyltransferase [Bacillus wiedmannii]